MHKLFFDFFFQLFKMYKSLSAHRPYDKITGHEPNVTNGSQFTDLWSQTNMSWSSTF